MNPCTGWILKNIILIPLSDLIQTPPFDYKYSGWIEDLSRFFYHLSFFAISNV